MGAFNTNPTGSGPQGLDDQSNFRADMDELNSLGDQSDEASQIVDDLDLDEKPPAKPKKKVEPEEGEDEEKLLKEEDEEKLEVEEKDEEEKPKEEPTEIRHSRPTVQGIKSKYPDFFKDFPDMRHVLFREGEYAQLFPTVDDAKEASEKVTDFDNLADLFNSGREEDLVEFLGGVAKTPATLVSLAGNFLPSLYKTNRDLYFQTTTPIGEALVRNAHARGVSEGNDNLKNAALVLAKWAFGDYQFATGEKKSEPPQATQTKDPRLEQEREEFYREKYNDTRNYIETNRLSKLKSEIKRGLDPNDVFNDFTSNLLMNQIIDEIGQELEKDQRHMSQMNSLWKQARKAGFAGNWKDRILTTYLSRARAIMPAIRARNRAEALKDKQQQSDKTRQIAGKSSERKEVPGSGSSGTQRGDGRINTKAVDWGKTTDMDIINDRVTYRK